jgi:Heterokaryon incompatibility protein (HET)
MSEAAQTHRYLPLDAGRKEIRLLTVYPRSQNIPYTDPVKCTIHHVSLRETPRPQYETISYVWGNARETSTVFLNGLEAIVPTSTEQALKCIRLHTGARDRQLWIDAICIDQGNVDERAKQVHIMGDIYQCSVANLIYIGDDDGMVGRACLDFRHLLEEIRQETDGFRTFLDTVFDKDNHDWRGNDSPLSTKIDPAALISFYSRPWFG